MSEPEPRQPPAPASRWRYRMVYGSVMLGFTALLLWTGSGPPATRAAFEKLVGRALQRYVQGVRVEHLAEGVLLASGERVFEVFELTEGDWKAHMEGGDGRDQKLLAPLVERLKSAQKAADALAADPDRSKRFAALPLPLAHFHETVSQSLAASRLAIQRVGDVPAYLFFRDAEGQWRPVTRKMAESGGLGPSKDALFEAALANAAGAEWSLGENGALKAADSPLPPVAALLAPGFEAKARELLGAEAFQVGARSPWSVRLFAGEAQAFEAPENDAAGAWPNVIVFAFKDGKLAYEKRL